VFGFVRRECEKTLRTTALISNGCLYLSSSSENPGTRVSSRFTFSMNYELLCDSPQSEDNDIDLCRFLSSRMFQVVKSGGQVTWRTTRKFEVL